MVFPALLAALTLAQDLEPIPPSLYDRVVELELTAADESAIDGHGPTAVVEYEVEFEGTLHVWTTSELDLFLRVDDANEARPLASDDDSGGGTTPYLRLTVHKGDWLVVLVAGDPGVTGPVALHLIAAPETTATRSAVAASRDAITEMSELLREDRRAAAEDLLGVILAELATADGALNSERVSEVLFDIGTLAFQEMGRVRHARDAWGRTVRHRVRTLPNGHDALLFGRGNLAISMHDMGDLIGAHKILEAVLVSFERRSPIDAFGLLTAQGNLAISMDAVGDLAGARALRESVLAGYEAMLPKEHPLVIRAQANLAISMDEMGDLLGARALKESVLAARDRMLPAGHPDLDRARSNLAVSMSSMGDFEGAYALYETVLATFEQTLPEGHPSLRNVRLNLASTAGQMGNFARTRALCESVLEACEKALPADHPELLRARSLLAVLMCQVSELSEARRLFESILVSKESTLPLDHPDLLQARANLANCMRQMGDRAGAWAFLPAQLAGMRMRVLSSLALAPRQVNQVVMSERQRLSAVLFMSASAAPEVERMAFELAETMRLVTAEAARSLARFEADARLGSILQRAAQVRRALGDHIVGAARERREHPVDGLGTDVTRLSLERDSLEREASRRLAERGVVTRPVNADALGSALRSGDLAVGYLRVAISQVTEETGWIHGHVDHLLAHVMTSDGALSRIDLGPASGLEELVSRWRSALGAPIRALGTLDSTGRFFELGTPVTDASRGIALLTRVGGRMAKSAELEAGRALRARILDPVLEGAKTDVKRIFACADDLLFLLPLDALPFDDEDEGPIRVGDRLLIVNEVSFARLLSPSAPAEAAPSLLAFGGVDYDAEGAGPERSTGSSAPIEASGIGAGGSMLDELDTGDSTEGHASRSSIPDRFEKLLQARIETEAAAVLFEDAFVVNPTLLTGKQTTKAALFQSAPGKRYVHLATHGWFAPESVRSTEDAQPVQQSFARMGIEARVIGLAPMTLCGLALAGANRGRDSLGRVPGILTAEELCSLDLSRCELAVLSACETNVGIRRAGQGIQSLQSALYAAGARTSITSLWKVDDAATRRLFEVFYRSLWIEKMGKADALWRAKMALRDQGYAVRDWAGWVLTGDPN